MRPAATRTSPLSRTHAPTRRRRRPSRRVAEQPAAVVVTLLGLFQLDGEAPQHSQGPTRYRTRMRLISRRIVHPSSCPCMRMGRHRVFRTRHLALYATLSRFRILIVVRRCARCGLIAAICFLRRGTLISLVRRVGHAAPAPAPISVSSPMSVRTAGRNVVVSTPCHVRLHGLVHAREVGLSGIVGVR